MKFLHSFYVLLFTASLGTWFSSQAPTYRSISSVDSIEEERRVTIFLIDGLSDEVFKDQLKKGHLPNMQKLIREGTYIEKGITSFPSISGYAHYPYVTGEKAVKSGIFGLRWFDRSRESGNFRNYVGRTKDIMNDDLTPDAHTLFEDFHDHSHSTFNSLIVRSSKNSEVLGIDFTLAKFKKESVLVATLNVFTQVFNAIPKFGITGDIATTPNDVETKVIQKAMEKMKDKIQYIVFTSADNINHLEGFRTEKGYNPKYISVLRHMDKLIGDYRAESVKQGTEDSRIYLLTSDHGITTVKKNINIGEDLEKKFGLHYDRDQAVRSSTKLDKLLDDYVKEKVDMIQAIQGNNMSFLYLKDPKEKGKAAWKDPLPLEVLKNYPLRGAEVDLVQETAALEGVEFVMTKGQEDNSFLITSRNGVGRISTQRTGFYFYEVIEGSDPLSYPSRLLGKELHEDEWMKETKNFKYPYAVPLIAQLLKNHADADMTVTTLDGFDHGKDFEIIVGNYRGGHGGLDAQQIVVPMVLTGPGVKKGKRLDVARAEDVGNTLKVLLGVSPQYPDRVLLQAIEQNK